MKKNIEVAERLRKLRGNLSQKAFSEGLGIPFRTYQYYESGERVPKSHTLSKIAKLCDTTADWILTGELKRDDFYLQGLVETLVQILARRLRFHFTAAKLMGSKEDKEENQELSEFLKDEKKVLDFVRNWIRKGLEEPGRVKHFGEISDRSPLYSLFRRIEEIYNKGDKGKFDAIKSFLDTLE